MKNLDMGEQISTFKDGELNGQDVDHIITRLKNDKEMKCYWERCHLISEAVKKNLPLYICVDLSNRIMQQIENEPTVLAPASPLKDKLFPIFKQISGLAVAASVMLVVVYVAQNFSGIDKSLPMQATISQMPSVDEFVRIPATKLVKQENHKLDQYLVDHNYYSGGVQGVLPYARIIGHASSKKSD
jgi:negative regulator of sigma E activity